MPKHSNFRSWLERQHCTLCVHHTCNSAERTVTVKLSTIFPNVAYFPEYKPHFERSKFTQKWECGLYSDDQINSDKKGRYLYSVAKMGGGVWLILQWRLCSGY